MSKNSTNCETPNQYFAWSFCLALVGVLALADVCSGGLIREYMNPYIVEYTAMVFFAIVTLGVYVLNAPPGVRFIRSYSRHKL